VVNASSAAIHIWSVELDLLRGLDLGITRLWARNGQARADGDLLFMALASMHQLTPEVRLQCYSEAGGETVAVNAKQFTCVSKPDFLM
jgi:hypothetical protein